MNPILENIYNLLKSQNVKVPDTHESFASQMQADPKISQNVYDLLSKQNIKSFPQSHDDFRAQLFQKKNPTGFTVGQHDFENTSGSGWTSSEEEARVKSSLLEGDNGVGRLASAAGTFDKSAVSALVGIPKTFAIGFNKIIGGDLEQDQLYKASKWAEKLAAESFPTNPKYQEEFLASKLPDVAATLMMFFMGGKAGQTARAADLAIPSATRAVLTQTAEHIPTAFMASASTAAQEYQNAINSGADQDTAYQAWEHGMLTGVPFLLTPTFKAFNQAIGGPLKLTPTITGQAIDGGITGFFQMGSSQALANLGAQETYDKVRKITDGVMDAGGSGFAINGVLSGLMAALTHHPYVNDPMIAQSIEYVKAKQKVLSDNNIRNTDFYKSGSKPLEMVEQDGVWVQKGDLGKKTAASGEVSKPALGLEQDNLGIKAEEAKNGTAEEANLSTMSTSEIEKTMSDIETDKSHSARFAALENEINRRERSSVFDVSLDDAMVALKKLSDKERDKPNGFGPEIHPADIKQSMSVITRYKNPGKLTDNDLRNDFRESIFGNPDSWYADGLKLRESIRVASDRGINIPELSSKIEAEFVRDGFSAIDAHKTVVKKLKSVGYSVEQSNISESNRITNEPVTEPIPSNEQRQTDIRQGAEPAVVNAPGEEPGNKGINSSFNKIKTPEEFKTHLQNSDWSILTAENKGGVQQSDAENKAQNDKLVEKLQAMGFNPVPVEGKYGGNPEHSFYVPGLTQKQATELGKEFGQQSVLTPKGLVYEDGSVHPADLKNINLSSEQSDYFSKINIGGQEVKFSVPIDFENKIQEHAIQERSTTQIPVGGTSGRSQEVGREIPQPEKSAETQGEGNKEEVKLLSDEETSAIVSKVLLPELKETTVTVKRPDGTEVKMKAKDAYVEHKKLYKKLNDKKFLDCLEK